MHLSFQKVFYFIATVIGLFTILILAKAVLIPIAFALLVAFILFPVAKKLEFWGTSEIMAALLSILALFLIIGGGIFLFSNQAFQIPINVTDFKDKILKLFSEATSFINQNFGFLPQQEDGELLDKIVGRLKESAGTLLSQSVIGTADFFLGLSTTIIFTFLILIYRKGLVQAFISFYPQENREKAFKMFKSVQQVGQQYLFGMLGIILILGVINSFGLWIIGIDNPFLFGFLAAVLALIPYVGTFLGAAIPILYSFMFYSSIWMPLTIALFFWFVQFLEGNFLTPKIVGGNLEINVLASIISIIIGASVWGVAGMILFLPFTAMLKVVCEEYEELKPVALLIGEQNEKKKESKDFSDTFLGKWLMKIKSWF